MREGQWSISHGARVCLARRRPCTIAVLRRVGDKVLVLKYVTFPHNINHLQIVSA